MAYSDFPMPDDYPPYARHDQVAAYFEHYVDHFGFRHTHHLRHDRRARSRAPPTAGGTSASPARTAPRRGPTTPCWSPTATTGTPAGRSRPTPATFAGEQIHAHDYRSGDQLARARRRRGGCRQLRDGHRRRVVLRARVRRRGRCAARSGCCASSSSAGPATRSRCPGWLPWWVTAARLRIGATAGRQHDEVRPAAARRTSRASRTRCSRSRSASGWRRARSPPEPAIERLDGDRVVFVDGTSAPADLIVWATGYRVSFPFLDPSSSRVEDNDLPLWKRTVHPDLPGLYFVGLLQPLGAVMPLAEAQAAWIAETLAGRLRPAVRRRGPPPDAGRARARHEAVLRLAAPHAWRSTSTTTCGTSSASARKDVPVPRPRGSPREPTDTPRTDPHRFRRTVARLRCGPCAGRRSARCRSAASSSARRTPPTGTGC